MNQKRIANLIIVLIFLLMLALPVLFLNRVPEKVSPTENRKLAAFPVIFDKEGKLAPGIRMGFETWINDNIGFREQFLKVAANIKVKIFHSSTSEKVHIGEDGWYFYTPNSNLEIASGEYPLSDAMLKAIARKQQAISNYYKSQGVDYVLVLTPSKASVYPEYIGGADYRVGVSPVDIVEDYLLQHTDVKVVNTKTALIEKKGEEKLFLKTDTHFTQYGSYLAYRAIYDSLTKCGILPDGNAVDVELSKGALQGEFSAMLGVPKLLALEEVPTVQWERHTEEIKGGEKYKAIDDLCKQNNDAKRYQPYLYENPNASGKKLLIYGDSQWMPMRNIPILLGEHFDQVVSIRMRTPDIAMDSIVRPDVVMFGCSERFINTILLRDLTVPDISRLPDLPVRKMISQEEYGEWIGNQGICLDSCNDRRVGGRADVNLEPSEKSIKLYGWAADFCNGAPFQELYLRIGDIITKCEYGIERTSVVDHFKKDSLLKTGFRVEFPITYLQDAKETEIAFVGVSADGQYLYEPVKYRLYSS